MSTSDLKAATLALVEARPSASRRDLDLRVRLVVGASIAASLAIFVLAGGIRRYDRPLPLLIATSAGAALIAAVGLSVAWGRGASMLGRRRRALITMLVVLPVALFAWKLLATVPFPDMMERWPDRVGLKCLRWSLLLGGLPLAAIVATRRDSVPISPSLIGGALGMAAGASSWVLVDLWCPVGYPPHLVLGHVLPTLLLCCLGAVLGHFVMALRRR